MTYGKNKIRRVTIVVPVYGDITATKDCLLALSKYIDHQKHTVTIVNDNGPEADTMEKMINVFIKKHSNFHYFRNENNVGFIKTCNKAVLELDTTSNDILLLNSDTEVTKGFLEEMLNVLYTEDSIGVVSPRSNNATIMTVPLSSATRKGIEAKDSFELFKELKKTAPRYSIVPTAHGFCMLIKRELINQYGLFDEVFGKGYGEEVDFCLRIGMHGYKSVISNHAYVFHLEARSFTLETKNQLLEKNNQIIKKRYPAYQQLVSTYINEALFLEEGIEPRKSKYDSSLHGRIKNKLASKLKKNRYLYKIAKTAYNIPRHKQ